MYVLVLDSMDKLISCGGYGFCAQSGVSNIVCLIGSHVSLLYLGVYVFFLDFINILEENLYCNPL